MSYVFKRGWINLSISMGMSSFRNYIDELEGFLSSQVDELIEEYKEEVKGMDTEEAQHVYEYKYEDQLYFYREEFPNILRKSFIISIYSFLEQELNNICKHFNRNYEMGGIFQSNIFLREEAGVNFQPFRDEWDKIEKINIIRNYCVHNGKTIINEIKNPQNKKDKKNNAVCSALKYFNLAVMDNDYIDESIFKYDVNISSEFCKTALNIIGEFFDKLTDSLKLY